LLGRAVVPADRAARLAAALEVVREHYRVALARALEPLGRQLVAERAVRVGEHRVRGLAEERVAECVLLLARELRLAAAEDELALDEARERVADRHVVLLAAEERGHAALPERLAEDARRAQDEARRRLEALEARLRHRDDRVRQRVSAALRDAANQL